VGVPEVATRAAIETRGAASLVWGRGDGVLILFATGADGSGPRSDECGLVRGALAVGAHEEEVASPRTTFVVELHRAAGRVGERVGLAVSPGVAPVGAIDEEGAAVVA
jgi:hypothetical protein